MSRKAWVLVGVVLLVIVSSIGLSVLRKSQKAAEEAARVTTLNMLGGGPTFGTANAQMADFNKSVKVKIDILSEDKITNFDDYSKVDLIQAGSISTVNDLRNLPAEKAPKIYGEIVMSTSPNMLWVKANSSQNDLQPNIDAGYIYSQEIDGQTVYFIDPDKLSLLVHGDVDNKKFNDPSIGVNIDANINFGFPNSSGGRTSAAQLLSCYFNGCEEMVTSNAVVLSQDKDGKDVYNLAPEYKRVLLALYERSGKQPADEYSVDYCYNWLNQNTNSVRIAIFPESCYAAWAISNTGKEDLMKTKGNVGVVITKTVVNTFTIIATSEAGKAYIDMLSQNDQFFQVVSVSTGMRGAGLVSIPPVSLGSFIAPNEPYQQMTFPFGQLTSAIKTELKSYGK